MKKPKPAPAGVGRPIRSTLVAAVLAVGLIAPAVPAADTSRRTRLVGTVIAVDQDARRLEIRDAAGILHELYWDAGSALLTRPRQGLRMRFVVATTDDGRLLLRRAGKADKPSRR